MELPPPALPPSALFQPLPPRTLELLPQTPKIPLPPSKPLPPTLELPQTPSALFQPPPPQTLERRHHHPLLLPPPLTGFRLPDLLNSPPQPLLISLSELVEPAPPLELPQTPQKPLPPSKPLPPTLELPPPPSALFQPPQPLVQRHIRKHKPL